jgi:diadenosine tetraphosphatase ApaH/serine/threonine PP2A family protein phosphatase
VAFERVSAANGIELVGPGSVGLPVDGDRRAAYALLHDDGRIERRRVAYDHAASAARVREVADGAPWGEIIAGRIERASMS